MSCTYWTSAGYCGHGDTRSYLVGERCPAHTPAALAGKPEPDALVDHALTLDGRRAAAGLVYAYRATDSALIDERAIASGRRRSNPAAYRLAQTAEDERRAAR